MGDTDFLPRDTGYVASAGVRQQMETAMKLFLTAALVLAIATPALADATCDARAKDKKLAGAALTSFMKKCEKDSQDTCSADAKVKNLHGAAESSFTKKCVKDAVGAG